MLFIKEMFLRVVVKPLPDKVVASVKPVSAKPLAVEGNDLLARLEEFLRAAYDFRFNLVAEMTEYRRKADKDAPFRTVGQRELNTICLAAQRNGINCWDRDVARFINSEEVEAYHPFRLYMDSLPAWDGTDRLTELARRVSDKKVWVEGFRRWMLGVAAQWMEMDRMHANSVAPVLVSKKQGMHKSTFCKMLMPACLQPYYTDCFDLNAASGAEQKLAAFGLINMDEFDKLPAGRMALLKNLMQMAELNIKKAYRKNFAHLPRVASFIATSNQKELLPDPSGSRRFLCVEVEHKIDCSPIDHAQVYAQLKQMLASGERYWFTTEEEAEIMLSNAPFQKHGMAEDLFCRYYRLPAAGEEPQLLLASDIYEHLRKLHPASMRAVQPNVFAKTLTAMNLERVRRSTGRFYKVVRRA